MTTWRFFRDALLLVPREAIAILADCALGKDDMPPEGSWPNTTPDVFDIDHSNRERLPR